MSARPLGPLVSIVVPVLDEAAALPGLLDDLAQLSGRFEVVVADGGSSDGSAEIARAHPLAPRVVSARGRARQLNTGATVARGRSQRRRRNTRRPAPLQLRELSPYAGLGRHNTNWEVSRMGFMDRMKGMQQQAQDAMSNAPGMQQQGMGGGDMAAQAAYAQLAQKLHASGVEAPGTVNAIRPTGQTDMGGGQQVEFDVTITPTGGDPYQTTISQSMLPAQLEGIAPGAAITVKYDPENPQMALMYGW